MMGRSHFVQAIQQQRVPGTRIREIRLVNERVSKCDMCECAWQVEWLASQRRSETRETYFVTLCTGTMRKADRFIRLSNVFSICVMRVASKEARNGEKG